VAGVKSSEHQLECRRRLLAISPGSTWECPLTRKGAGWSHWWNLLLTGVGSYCDEPTSSAVARIHEPSSMAMDR